MPDSGSFADGRLDSGDPVRWAKAHDLFHAALELGCEEREAFLEAACGADEALRREVASLLASDRQAGEFIEEPAAALMARTPGRSFTPRLAPGTVLGRYEILHFLGAGGVSEVYRARDGRLGRTVALKLVTDPGDREAGARLLTEAQHASILNHPNICGVYEAEDGDGLPFIVLELVEGPTLHDVMSDRHPSMAEAIQWGREIAAALDHAHRRGIVHRDLKSANVALSPDGTVKVLDFGLSRRLAPSSGAPQSPAAILTNASVAGTLTHIAPEVLRGASPDQRVDVWALGVMLYEMTSGRLPFKRATPLETAEAILDEAPEPLPRGVPHALRQVIERCLAKDPAARFSTAAELRAALASLPQGQIDAGRRWPTRAALAAAGLALAAAAVLGGLGYFGRPPAAREAPVLAVLPFGGGDADPAQAFFADGVTEALIAELGRIDGIRVIAPTTVMRYRKGSASARELTRDAGASRLVEGSVTRNGGQVRLSARLIEASSGRVLWSDEYERDMREVQALHSTVAAAVARAAQVDVTAEDARHFATVRAVDPDVYEAYLKGRYYWNQRTPGSIRTAIAHFETAVTLDPTYAPAYAALADNYNQLATVLVGGGSPLEWRPRAAAAAIKALQIDGQLAEAHATLGFVHHYNWQWNDAEQAFRRAIALNPSYALARIWYANLLCSLRRFDEAIREVLVARDLDPLSLIVHTNVGWVYFRARRYDEAIAVYARALALDPTYLQAHIRLSDAYYYSGRLDDALAETETVARLSNHNLSSALLLEQVKSLTGRPNDFDRRLAELIAQRAEGYASPGTIANAYFAVGRNDEGLRWLEQAYRERTNNMAYLAVEPIYDKVRDDPRFQAFVRAVGLP